MQVNACYDFYMLDFTEHTLCIHIACLHKRARAKRGKWK